MRRSLTTIPLVLALLLAGCGSEADETADGEVDAQQDDVAGDDRDEDTGDAGDGDADGDFPVTVTDDRGTEVEIVQRPERIVSLSPTHTEVLFAVGAGEQVAAVDSQSNHPPEAPTTELAAFEPNVEAVLEEDPDLVVTSYDTGDFVDGLEAVDVDVLFFASAMSLDAAFAQMEAVGEATGNAEGGRDLVADLQAEMDEIADELPEPDEPLTYFHELDDALYTATSQTFIGEVYAVLGLENIADEADEDGTGFPQLSPEAVVEADPDLIFLADAEQGQTPDVVAERPGWDTVTAVEEGNLHPVDSDLSSRWGPRVTDFLRDVADAVHETLERRE